MPKLPVIAATVCFAITLVAAVVMVGRVVLPSLLVQFLNGASKPWVKQLQNSTQSYLPTTKPEELFAKINQYRENHNLPAFKQDPATCAKVMPTGVPGSSSDMLSVCSDCSHAALLSITRFANPNYLLEKFLEDTSSAKVFNDPNLTHLCVKENQDQLLLFLARHQPAAAKPAAKITPQATAGPAVAPKNFTENQLWQALVDYRHAHQKPDLNKNEELCSYARKRVQDQLNDFKTKSPEEYPVPDKYPLDAHQGFANDAASGYAFQVTGMKELAENLAYYPSAQYANHIIEWGWDTSTEGHRETQLSTDYFHACITGDQGFYVAIFGRN